MTATMPIIKTMTTMTMTMSLFVCLFVCLFPNLLGIYLLFSNLTYFLRTGVVGLFISLFVVCYCHSCPCCVFFVCFLSCFLFASLLVVAAFVVVVVDNQYR